MRVELRAHASVVRQLSRTGAAMLAGASNYGLLMSCAEEIFGG